MASLISRRANPFLKMEQTEVSKNKCLTVILAHVDPFSRENKSPFNKTK